MLQPLAFPSKDSELHLLAIIVATGECGQPSSLPHQHSNGGEMQRMEGIHAYMAGVHLKCGDCRPLPLGVDEVQQHVELTSRSNFLDSIAPPAPPVPTPAAPKPYFFSLPVSLLPFYVCFLGFGFCFDSICRRLRGFGFDCLVLCVQEVDSHSKQSIIFFCHPLP